MSPKHLQSQCLYASWCLSRKYSPKLQAFFLFFPFFLFLNQSTLHLIYSLIFLPIKITWEAKSRNLRLQTNWVGLLILPVSSWCQTLCVDKTIYLYHFQAGQTGEGWEVRRVEGWGERWLLHLLSEGIDQPCRLLVSRWGQVPQEHFRAGPCQSKAVLSHDPSDGSLRETGIGVQIIRRDPQ